MATASSIPRNATVTVETRFDRAIYEKDGFAILATSDGFSVKGNLLDTVKSILDTPVTVIGEWESSKHGKTLAMRSYQVKENQIVFFLTRMVGSIPMATARQIAAEIGDALGDVMEKTPERLLDYKGIGKKKLARIQLQWAQFKDVQELGKLLLPYGVSNTMIAKIHAHFGKDAQSVATNDTYRLTEVRGIGFKKADEIAIRIGIDPDDPRRLAACAMYCMMEKIAAAGDTATTVDRLLASITEEILTDGLDLAATPAKVLDVLARLIDDRRLVTVSGRFPDNDAYLALAWYFWSEKKLLKLLADFGKQPPQQAVADIDAWIGRYEQRNAKILGEQQKAAVRLGNTLPPIMAIYGYAGTGKSTSAKAILEIYAEKFGRDQIVCCALSGVAANRVQVTSGFPGSTIHSLLGFRGNNDWTYNENNKLDSAVVLLDEGSMVDSDLMCKLFDAIDFAGGARLIILGDPAQLEPVGPGAPFADMLRHDLMPSIELDHIYRQSEGAVITTFAAAVRKGQVPDGYRSRHDDFSFSRVAIDDYWKLRKSLPPDEMKILRDRNNAAIRDRIMAIALRRQQAMADYLEHGAILEYLLDFQVLAPIKDSDVGVRELNVRLQETLNPRRDNEPEIVIADRRFRMRDKVVHLKNKNMDIVSLQSYSDLTQGVEDYVEPKRVYNGQFGMITRIVGEGDSAMIHVHYPNEKYIGIYTKEDFALGVVDLGWCLSIHKSQGSEYAYVVLPMTLSHFTMLTPKLLYTGMTRAKSALVLVGQPEAFEIGCQRIAETERVTCMNLLAKAA